MGKGISLHIGLNTVDPAHYQGWDGQLTACEFDAHDMEALARKQGFTRSVRLLTPQATANAVITNIRAAAKDLVTGDFFFLTYSGHGGQVPDMNHDEDENDRQDETWVLYDRELIDDELYTLWAKFKKGVRIAVLSDSCHSGTVLRARPIPGKRNRAMPPAVAVRTYRANKALYDNLQKATPAAERARINASVILISGCQDNQTSLDGDRNGLFTETLRKVWAGGRFKGGYQTMRNKIASRMPSEQSPNFYRVGIPDEPFASQKPFTL